jgi:hypothetical protein
MAHRGPGSSSTRQTGSAKTVRRRNHRAALPPNTLVQIGSAASSPGHVWLFGTNYNAGNQPLILSHS